MQLKHSTKYRKFVAAFMLTIMSAELLTPNIAYALTSGPAAPESSSFQQAGVTDMVDLFTGNFNYNLPVMDIDGYPLNLSYGSGSGMDDEASWVGFGWNLQVGSVTRQLRGLPDDMSGDKFETEHYTKPKVTVGGRVTAKIEFGGKATDLLKATGSFTLGVFTDNYTGIGAELGANAGISASFTNGGAMTAGMGIGLLSSTQSGVDVTPSLSLSYTAKIAENSTGKMGLSASLGYNTRAGLKSLTLGSSFSLAGSKTDEATKKTKNGGTSFDIGGSTISYNSEPVSPEIQIPYRSTHESYSFDIGGAAWLIFGGGGATGYRTVREVKDRTFSNPAYGFLYAENGKNVPTAMMDMQREKETMVMPELPNIAVPIHTPDLFSFTSQTGSGQFRFYRGGTGILFDNEAKDVSYESTMGFDAGVGAYAHGGVSHYSNTTKNVTKKWSDENEFKRRADFQDISTDPKSEHAFIKLIGEKTQEDDLLVEKLGKTEPVAVNVSGKTAMEAWRKTDGTVTSILNPVVRQERAKRRQSITYLTAEEADKGGLDKKINSYSFNNFGGCNAGFTPLTCHALPNPTSITRYGTGEAYQDPEAPVNNAYRKKHHISEITVTDEGGKRNVYGLPVYNARQTEYSYAIGKPSDYRVSGTETDVDQNNLVKLEAENNRIKTKQTDDNDHYYHRETQPGYASSFLLTGILSPDYVDVTNNGITDDDLGTAIKFNYSKLPGVFRWRSPYNRGNTFQANISRGLLANPDDDKASIVVGEKEIWYTHSVETKTKIAYFITEDRYDALGVVNLFGLKDPTKRQKVLREIRLYSKADISRPIKVVRFNYDYNTGANLPNFDRPSGAGDPQCDLAQTTPGTGKLTLRSVVFLYGNSPKGVAHPYVFHYNNSGTGEGAINAQIDYGYLLTDRWGTYKPKSANTTNPDNPLQLRNDEFPYTNQQTADVDLWASAWQLSKIELPTGGEITVHYESDDYAYVQNKRAMQMLKVQKLIDATGNDVTNLWDATGIKFEIPELTETLDKDKFISRFLNGSEYIYTKLFVDVAGYDSRNKSPQDAFFDFIPCYAKVAQVTQSGTTISVQLERITESGVTTNAIQIAAWQKMKLEYPRYSYPGYKNRVNHRTNAGKAISAALGAIVDAARTLDELGRNFYKRAKDLHFGERVNLNKSFIRVGMQNLTKKGGGNRVKKILISDNWNDMSGNAGITKQYGQWYDYTMQEGVSTISSGVASFEPGIGNDENPLRLPIPYVQKIRGAINNFFQLEEPFGESLFPAASVGYRKVTVRDLGEDGNPVVPAVETGYVVNEFYTAKEFPVITKATPNKVIQSGPSGWYSLFGSSSFHSLIFSQGYSIELNDMHGKPKAIRVYNKGGSEISSTVYHYNAEPYNAGEFRLKNKVKVVDETGEITNDRYIGREIEVFTDMREQESNSTGKMVASGVDVFPIPIISVPAAWPHWPYKENDSYKLFRSASTLKVIQYYGVIDKVVKTVDGSSVSSENLVYDGLTGEAVVTKTLNEFERPVYSVNIPAYWIHGGMGGAYKTAGTYISSLDIQANGLVGGAHQSFLNPGDELINLSSQTGQRLWVTESALNGTGTPAKRIIDDNGQIFPASKIMVKVLRSGYRNNLTAPGTSMVCQKDPVHVVGGKSRIVFADRVDATAWQVLTASALVYDDYWGMKNECATCPPGYQLMPDGNHCEAIMSEDLSMCFNVCAGAVVHNYGKSGARVTSNELPNNPVTTFMSEFYGGICPDCSGATGQTAVNAGKADNVMDSSLNALMAPIIYETCKNPYPPMPNDYSCDGVHCGRLNIAGIWLCTNNTSHTSLYHWEPREEDISIETCVDIPATGWYYFGYAADDYLRISVDGIQAFSLTSNIADNYLTWYVESLHLTAGKHKLRITFKNMSGHASAAVEIYNASRANILASNITPANILFSTRNLVGQQVQIIRKDPVTALNTKVRYKCSNGALPDVCNGNCGIIPVNRVVNPYVKGFKGNWRPMEAKAFLVNRKYKDIINQQNPEKEVDVKNAGNFEIFKPYWYYDATWKQDTAVKQWITSNAITLYDKYGQELENRDALNRYSGATFVFNGQLPAAVASNARHREILYESFEDTKFRQFCYAPGVICNPTNLRQNTAENNLPAVVNDIKHTGNYSASLPNDGLSISSVIHDIETKSMPYLNANNKGEFAMSLATTQGIYPNGFEPFLPKLPNGTKDYIFSVWVYDNQSATLTPGIMLEVNGQTIQLERKAVVEKWKLVEGKFTINANSEYIPFFLLIKPNGASNVKIDDLRIHPFDSHLKSYAYDEKTLRLMAEMDENNFATFYEYDDEGGLVRLKKETERGIMTIKENRSAKKKRPPLN